MVTVNIVLHDRVEIATMSSIVQIYFALAAMEAVSYFSVSFSNMLPPRCDTHEVHLVKLHFDATILSRESSTCGPFDVFSALSIFEFIVYSPVKHNIIAIFAE
jgi:hypothetical protein